MTSNLVSYHCVESHSEMSNFTHFCFYTIIVLSVKQCKGRWYLGILIKNSFDLLDLQAF